MKKNWTGERLETFIFNGDSIEHLHRYAIVSNYIKDKIVLDIASGEGYGCNLMSKEAKFVYGVDIDDITVQEAKLKYRDKKIEFLIGSTSEIPIEDSSIDVVVSFETIEHHDMHNEMMSEVKRVLRPKGLLIISTPDKLYYSDERNYKNQFHIKELYKQEFIDLVSKNFSNLQLLNQIYINGNSLIQEDTANDEVQIFSGNYSEISNLIINPMYLIAIASNDTFEKQKPTIFNGSQIIDANLKNQINKIYSSNSYRLGHLILLPLKIIKKLFN